VRQPSAWKSYFLSVHSGWIVLRFYEVWNCLITLWHTRRTVKQDHLKWGHTKANNVHKHCFSGKCMTNVSCEHLLVGEHCLCEHLMFRSRAVNFKANSVHLVTKFVVKQRKQTSKIHSIYY
jgi:hypothetical protein